MHIQFNRRYRQFEQGDITDQFESGVAASLVTRRIASRLSPAQAEKAERKRLAALAEQNKAIEPGDVVTK